MSNRKPAQYWDRSANPIIVKGGGYHCTKISPGCAGCWAEKTNLRFHNKIPYDNRPVEYELDQAVLKKISRRKIRTVYFMCDLMDYLHGLVPDTMVWELFKFMAHNKQHIYLILTKRADRFCNLIPEIRNKLVDRLFHVKFGLTVCNQAEADEKIPMVLPFIDWLSIEPMLGGIDLGRAFPCGYYCDPQEDGYGHHDHSFWTPGRKADIDWIVLGGESGAKARPMNPQWVRTVRDQCVAARVPLFFKQWGAWKPVYCEEGPEGTVLSDFKNLHFVSLEGELIKDPGPRKYDEILNSGFCPMQRRRSKDRWLDGKLWNQFPEDLQ